MEVPADILIQLPKKSFAAGETILKQGDASKGVLYFLESGCVEVVMDGQGITEERRPGATFGETSILLGLPHNADVVAKEDTTLFYAEEPDVFLHNNPAVTVLIAQILARRLHAMTDFFIAAKEKYSDLGEVKDMIFSEPGA